jgi:hypothetical protein
MFPKLPKYYNVFSSKSQKRRMKSDTLTTDSYSGNYTSDNGTQINITATTSTTIEGTYDITITIVSSTGTSKSITFNSLLYGNISAKNIVIQFINNIVNQFIDYFDVLDNLDNFLAKLKDYLLAIYK